MGSNEGHCLSAIGITYRQPQCLSGRHLEEVVERRWGGVKLRQPIADSREVLTVGSQAVRDLVTTIPWAGVQASSRLDSNGAQKLALLDLKSCLPPNVVC